MLSQTLQGRFLQIVLPILLLTIGVVAYSQYLVYSESSSNIQQNSTHNQIILQTKKVKETMQDLELSQHRDVILAPVHDPSIQQELEIIARSPKVPEITLCLKSEIAADLRERMANALFNMDKTPDGVKILQQFKILGFSKASKEDFAIIENMSRETLGSITAPGK
jgi:ABC-type phosphate/phosphonate transport system substrate-binding protein